MALLKLRTHVFLLLFAFLTPYISVVWLKKRKAVKLFLHISIIICWICIVPLLTSIYQTAPEVMFCCFSVNLLPNLRLLSQFESSPCSSHSLLSNFLAYIAAACPGLILVIWRFHLPCLCEGECHKDRQRVCYQEVAKPNRGNSVRSASG